MGERIEKIDEKVLQNPARILRSIPSSRFPYRGNENLCSGQRTKEGTRLGRASLIKAQKYIFELGEAADGEERGRGEAKTKRREERRMREQGLLSCHSRISIR